MASGEKGKGGKCECLGEEGGETIKLSKWIENEISENLASNLEQND